MLLRTGISNCITSEDKPKRLFDSNDIVLGRKKEFQHRCLDRDFFEHCYLLKERGSLSRTRTTMGLKWEVAGAHRADGVQCCVSPNAEV